MVGAFFFTGFQTFEFDLNICISLSGSFEFTFLIFNFGDTASFSRFFIDKNDMKSISINSTLFDISCTGWDGTQCRTLGTVASMF